jgi:hypothetical protein
MRKHLAWYCHASPAAAALRSRLVRVNRAGEVVECLENYAAQVAANFESAATAWRRKIAPNFRYDRLLNSPLP